MPIRESDLPGVGKKYEIDIDYEGRRLVIVTHNTGKREVFMKEDAKADAEKLFEVSDQLARKVGTILEGAYFQPVKDDTTETTLGDGTNIEWFEVAADADVVDRTFADLLADAEIDVAIVAIQRGERVIPASEAEERPQAGDTIVAVGSTEALDRFEQLVLPEGAGHR
ncbi:cation:proton antiporter regulatory subunit [Halovivax sp.]|uniref:cation:proton antiporter regulatory subunit n=1 Tax=Halovivax sp. TaxID=1935978 RepID=UPI0025BA3C24|nr:TrkA C-terminal domain-containing protein [Halovivax sp.]